MPQVKFGFHLLGRIPANKPANRLELHLLNTAKEWCNRPCIVFYDDVQLTRVETLEQLLQALRKECLLYCADNHPTVDSDSVCLEMDQLNGQDVITIFPKGGKLINAYIALKTT